MIFFRFAGLALSTFGLNELEVSETYSTQRDWRWRRGCRRCLEELREVIRARALVLLQGCPRNPTRSSSRNRNSTSLHGNATRKANFWCDVPFSDQFEIPNLKWPGVLLDDAHGGVNKRLVFGAHMYEEHGARQISRKSLHPFPIPFATTRAFGGTSKKIT